MRTQINKLKSRKHWELQGAKKFAVALIFRAVGGRGTLHKRAKGDWWNVYWLCVGWNEGLQVPRAPILAATFQTFPGGFQKGGDQLCFVKGRAKAGWWSTSILCRSQPFSGASCLKAPAGWQGSEIQAGWDARWACLNLRFEVIMCQQ